MGHFLLAGAEEVVAELGPKLAATNVPNGLSDCLYSLLQGGHRLRWKRGRAQRSLPRQGQSHGESQAGRGPSETNTSNLLRASFLMNN